MKNIFTIVFFFCMAVNAQAQILLNKFPKEKQLYARSLSTNKATVTASGKVTDTLYTNAKLKIWRNNALINTQVIPLSFVNDTANFLINYQLLAELASFKVELLLVRRTGTDSLFYTAKDVLAGDTYIIQGQSNAEAWQWSGDANVEQSPYIRVFGSGDENGSDSTWYIAQGNGTRFTSGNAGQWGLRLAKQIIDNQQIPIAIFNGARGGKPIQYFARNNVNRTDMTTNYGRLLKRVKQAGLQSSVRGIFWYQGEWNASGSCVGCIYTNTNQYLTLFDQLYRAWKQDYSSVTKLFVFQIRQGCGLPETGVLEIQEALRKLPQIYPDVVLMSTNGTQQHTDNCHYPYLLGYKVLAEWIYPLVANTMYQAVLGANQTAPMPEYAFLSAPNQITISTNMSGLVWNLGAENDFRIENSTVTIVSGSINGNTIILNLSANIGGTSAVSYKGHQLTSTPFVTNANNVGLLSFYNMPVLTASLSTQITALNIEQNNGLVYLYWKTSAGSTTNYFEVEHSTDGKNWQKITRLKADAQSADNSYAFLDENAASGNNFYRIKLIDIDEKVNYSPIVGARLPVVSAAATIYPNPAQGTLFVQLPSVFTKRTQLIVMDLIGRVVLEQDFDSQSGGTVPLNIGALPQGIYQLAIMSQNIQPQYLKFTVQ